jgi:isocitrate dehydrogenase (NAD+)
MPRLNSSVALKEGLRPTQDLKLRPAKNSSRRVTLIPGDGIGPEVVEAAVRAIDATGVRLQWDHVNVNAAEMEQADSCLPAALVKSLTQSRVALKGPVTSTLAGGISSVNRALRREFNLFANYRMVRAIPSLRTRYSDLNIDLVLFCGNIELLNCSVERQVSEGMIGSFQMVARTALLKIVRSAFDFAIKEHRRKVTAIHRTNTLQLNDGLFLNCCRDLASQYPAIRYEEMIVDTAAMHLVMQP